MIGLTNSWGLLPLALIPIIIILYMLRPKNTPRVIPSIYLWKTAIREIESASKFQKLKSSILLFLQILAIILLALMLAGLFIKGDTSAKHTVIVIDCSVSMQSEDVSPNRMEVAKDQAENFVRQLGEETEITLVALSELPEILLTNEKDQSAIIKTIQTLQMVDTYANQELTKQTIEVVKKDEETEVVYFGDRVIDGARNYRVLESNENTGIAQISYTKYPQQKSISVMVEVFQNGLEPSMLPISLYVDDLLFDAKQIQVEKDQTAKVFFDGIPFDVKEIKAQVDEEDYLVKDNMAFTIVTNTQKRKVALVTTSNIFLEKIIKLNPNLDLHLVEPKDKNALDGYDLYIYDSCLPDQLPTDGAILSFNPPKENGYFQSLGYIQQPELFSAGHEITHLLEQPKFSIGVTAIYELPSWGEAIYDTEQGVCAFSGIYNHANTVVYGFDLHNTDLPLSVEFPVLMVNTLNYLVPSSMLENSSTQAGEAMEITIYPNTKAGRVIGPDGQEYLMDLEDYQYLFQDTEAVGIYEVLQESDDQVISEKFAVNVPRREETIKISDSEDDQSTYYNPKSLLKWLGILVVLILVIEWFIYSYRRRTHEIKL